MQQRRLDGGLRVVLLLVLAVAFSAAAGADDSAVLIALDVHLALVPAAGEGAGGELFHQALIVRAQALEDGDEGRNEAEATMSVGSSSGSRKTGTMMRAIFVVPSRLSRSARPMFCTISTCEPRVSAKHTASTPTSPVMSTPSPSTRTEARKARLTRWPAASRLFANCPRTSRRSLTRWSPHSHADHTRCGRTWRPASSSYSRASIDDSGIPSAAARASSGASVAYSSAAVSGSFSANACASSTRWWNVMTVRRFHLAECSSSAVCNSARRRPRSASSDSPRTGEGSRISRTSISKPARISRSIASESPSSASHSPYVPSGSLAMLAISTSWPPPFCGWAAPRMRGVAVR